MEFKKASRNVKFDDFVNGADETAKPKNEKTQEKKGITLKLPISLAEEIDKMIIPKDKTLSLKNFTKLLLLNENQFLNDKAMIKIYKEAKFFNLDIAEYIKQKLEFIKIAKTSNEPKKQKTIFKSVLYTKEEKDLLMKKVLDSNLTLNEYIVIKLKMGIITMYLFNQKEMEEIIKNSSKANISPKEYISNKILE